ncbi:vWA domain-containing protein [Streptomyces sp. SID3343]|uniref:VWA domain-containing protein n=1 Tax=Streptomyces sp. SID3343 TaxID=2690260 RepID=UPI001368A81F|nr:VWA domain-containing protein [Streptomyces sp. SID3343]
MTAALGVALLPGLARAAETPVGDPNLKVAPISYAVLVDESGSLKGPDLDREKDAAALAAIGELSPESRVGVVGFGSGAGEKSAVDEACRMTAVTDPAVTTCAGKLHARTDQEGNNTDIPAAIRQGVSMLRQEPAGQARVLFVLTDGAMAVEPGEGYGNDTARIPGELDKALTSALAEAKAAGVQIWPLGFGSGINAQQLTRIAEGGAPASCANRPGEKPTATTAKDSGEVVSTLRKAFATARCAGVTSVDDTNVTGEADLKVTIPAIATDVVIQVQKADGQIETTFFDPNGKQVERGDGIEQRGQQTRTETLRVSNPVSGTWRVHLKAPAGVSGPVSAAALWQGVVKSYVQLNPPQPAVGQDVRFSVFLQTREGNLTDTKALDGVTVSGHVEGAGLKADVPLKAGAKGEFSAAYKIPDGTTGPISFTGTVVAPGVDGTRETKTVTLGQGPAPVSVEATWGNPTIEPGGSVTGSVKWKVNDAKEHTLRVLAGFPSRTGVRIDGGEHKVSAGSDSFDVKLRFDDDIAEGDHTGRVTVVDAGAGDVVLWDGTVTVTVEPPPGFWEKYLWLVIGAVVLLALLAGLLAYWAKRRRRGRRIGPVALRLYRDGQQVGVETRPLDENAEAMWFRLDTTTFPPQLIPLYQQEPGTSWTVRRLAATGTLDLETPLGTHLQLDMGRPTEVETGLAIGFQDDRVQAQGGVPGGPGGPAGDSYGPYGAEAGAMPRPYDGGPYGGAYGGEATPDPYGPYGSGPSPGPGSGYGTGPGPGSGYGSGPGAGPDDNGFGYGPPRT